MTEAEFEDLLQRYLNGTSRPGERELVERWSNQLGTPDQLLLPPAEREEVRAAMWHQIEQLTRDTSATDAGPQQVSRRLASFWRTSAARWLAAALLVVGVALAAILPRQWPSKAYPSGSANSWTRQRNTSSHIQQYALADGSHVALYPGSSMQYRRSLAGPRREVRLQGEAFFQVAKNPNRPFLVYTDQLLTTVLGTSFRVTAYAGRTHEVAVREGRVSVQIRKGAQLSATPARPAAQGVVLRPNQQVTYAVLQSRPLQKQLVANPVVLEPQGFTFHKQPVTKVLQALEKAYGVDIRYDEGKLANCTITVTFYQESLYEKLDLLSQALGATYAAGKDATILFQSQGCAP